MLIMVQVYHNVNVSIYNTFYLVFCGCVFLWLFICGWITFLIDGVSNHEYTNYSNINTSSPKNDQLKHLISRKNEGGWLRRNNDNNSMKQGL